MDQQQEQPKKKRPYYNNRHRSHNNRPPQDGNDTAAQNNTTANNTDAYPAPTNNAPPASNGGRPQNHRPDGRQDNRPNNNRVRNGNNAGGDIHTRRGGFRPAPEVIPEEGKQPVGELKEARAPAESRENRSGNKNRSGKGRSDSRPRDGVPRDNRPGENEQRENKPAARTEGNRGGENRPRRSGDTPRDGRDRPRRDDGKPTEAAPRREVLASPRDAEMDSWFAESAPSSSPARSESRFLAEQEAHAVDPETLPHIELSLSDILPAIALEKYEDKEKPTEISAEESQETPTEPIPVIEVVGVRFNKTGKVYYFAPNGNTARRGDAVIVETARGLEFGEVWQANHTVPESEIVPPLRPVVRMADAKDIAHNADNRRREDDAFHICLEKIAAHGLDMKLVEAQYTFDNSKLLFYFTSAGRVDFRELVKDLASVFRTRIELRQIGIRDEAKLMGGLGICGRSLCCASFLSDFSQVSIKMAKEQNLSLNSAKISGACGRLMCCLNYEYPVYCEAARHTPSVGSTVATPDGNGTVTEASPLSGTVRVALLGAPAGSIPQYYRREDVHVISDGRRHTTDIPDSSDHGENGKA